MACRVSFEVLYFNSSLYSRHTKLPGRKCARPRRGAAGAGRGHVPGGSASVLAAGAGRGQLLAKPAPPRPRPGGRRVRPRRRRWPLPPVAAAGASCGHSSLSSLLCVFSLPRPPQHVASAAATSLALVGVTVVNLFFASAVPAGGARRGHVCVGIAGVDSAKFYKGEAAESILNNVQCCDLENESVPL